VSDRSRSVGFLRRRRGGSVCGAAVPVGIHDRCRHSPAVLHRVTVCAGPRANVRRVHDPPAAATTATCRGSRRLSRCLPGPLARAIAGGRAGRRRGRRVGLGRHRKLDPVHGTHHQEHAFQRLFRIHHQLHNSEASTSARSPSRRYYFMNRPTARISGPPQAESAHRNGSRNPSGVRQGALTATCDRRPARAIQPLWRASRIRPPFRLMGHLGRGAFVTLCQVGRATPNRVVAGLPRTSGVFGALPVEARGGPLPGSEGACVSTGS
jgi:hypothetical protein